MSNQSKLFNGKSLVSDFFLIEIKEVDPINGLIYESRQGKGDNKFAFWEVKPSENFFTLGSLFTEYYDIDKRAGRSVPITITLSPKEEFPDLLAAPLDYELIWDDKGTKNPNWVYIWRMIPPPGYQALGYIATKSNQKPMGHNAKCVKETVQVPDSIEANLSVKGIRINNHITHELLTRANFTTNKDSNTIETWIDKGSRAEKDLALFFPKVTHTPHHSHEVYLVPGTFLASNNYRSLPHEEPYALVLSFPGVDVLSHVDFKDNAPKLTRNGMPSKQELQQFQVVERYELPFFAVKDRRYSNNQLLQSQESPVYTLQRIVNYDPIDGYLSQAHQETKEYTEVI